MIRAGRLLDRVKVQRNQKSRTDTGAFTETLTDLLTCRAGIENISAKSSVEGERESSFSTFRVVLRKPSNITVNANDIVLDLATNRSFDIMSVVYKGRNTYLELICEEKS